MTCTRCQCTPCGCSSGLKPYYETDPCLQSSDCCGEKVYVCHYTPVIRVQGAWAVPLADEIISLRIPALADILLYSVLWNPDYGSYLIVAYDGNDLIQVSKTQDNVVPNGTPIPSCTKFVVTIPFEDIINPSYQSFIANWVGVGAGTVTPVTEVNLYAPMGDTVNVTLNNEVEITVGTLTYLEFDLPFQPSPNAGLGQMVAANMTLIGTASYPATIDLQSNAAKARVYRTDEIALATGNWIIQQNFFYKKGA